MARRLGETTITISVLDRLIDLEPDNRLENPLSRTQSVRLAEERCAPRPGMAAQLAPHRRSA